MLRTTLSAPMLRAAKDKITMALPVTAILKALPSILSASSAIINSLKSRRDTPGGVRSEEEIKRLEDDLLNASKLLGDLTRQVQALATEVRAQADAADRREKQLRTFAVVAFASAGVALAALLVPLFSAG